MSRPRKQEQEDAVREVSEVAPGIIRMQLPIQFTGLGHVNCYALEDEKGWTVVDPGLPGRDSWVALTDRLGQLGAGTGDVHTVVVTHSHPDHFGGAGKLGEDNGARVVTHEAFRTWFDADDIDDRELEDGSSTTPDDRERARRQRRRPLRGRRPAWGGKPARPPARIMLRFAFRRRSASKWFAPPRPTNRLEEADVITLGRREWVAMHTPGHTTDHLCLFDPSDGVLLSGDHVLPTITPHIAGAEREHRDTLREFFDSLERTAALDGVELVLPAHGHPFTDLPGRVKDIERHHEDRLDQLREISAELGPSDVSTLSQRLFAPRAWGHMAESETFAHLEHLRLLGEMDRVEEGGRLVYSTP